MRCGRNASDFEGIVKTATVLAGDTVGIAAGEPMLEVRSYEVFKFAPSYPLP